MRTCCYKITGGDYENAGSASSRLKAELKRIGIAPDILRRTIIAAYEAETNVVIHALRGDMRVTLDDSQIDIEVEDEGPGIPDIEMAMREGFSTAPPAARELGFGAGMGLPNICRSSDRFDLKSEVGKGTHLRFSVNVKPQEDGRPEPNSLRILAEACIGCLQCLRNCPTHAVRVWNDRPSLLEHLCVDCAACIGVCVTGALALEAEDRLPSPLPQTLVVPSSFMVQFGSGVEPNRVRKELNEMGFRRIIELRPWHEALRQAVLEYANRNNLQPAISPTCGAVINLIRMRFPSLLGSVAPYLSPIEAAQQEVAEESALLVASCPCQRTALADDPSPAGHHVISPAVLRNVILARIGSERRHPKARIAAKPVPREAQALQVTGIWHVIRVLEEMENGILGDVRAVEFYACDQGCSGSPLLVEDPFVTQRRLRTPPVDPQAKAVRRAKPFAPRGGMRLDGDMGHAIEKLSRIEAVRKTLPGKDCSLCGSPTCDTMAEDIVLGRASGVSCIHLKSSPGGRNEP